MTKKKHLELHPRLFTGNPSKLYIYIYIYQTCISIKFGPPLKMAGTYLTDPSSVPARWPKRTRTTNWEHGSACSSPTAIENEALDLK